MKRFVLVHLHFHSTCEVTGVAVPGSSMVLRFALQFYYYY